MKAWMVEYDGCYTIVFAETRNKARVLGLKTDAALGSPGWGPANYIELDVWRRRDADHLYRGEPEINYDDPEVREWFIEKCRVTDWWFREEMCSECAYEDDCPKLKSWMEEDEDNDGR